MFVKAGVKTACLTILAQTHDNVIIKIDSACTDTTS